jgi:hypothetical protein
VESLVNDLEKIIDFFCGDSNDDRKSFRLGKSRIQRRKTVGFSLEQGALAQG